MSLEESWPTGCPSVKACDQIQAQVVVSIFLCRSWFGVDENQPELAYLSEINVPAGHTHLK